MADIIQLRRDAAADWTSANPTLANGEIGYETDTKLFKIGDGSTAWTSLGYITFIPLWAQATEPSPNPGVFGFWYKDGSPGETRVNMKQTNGNWAFHLVWKGGTP